MIHSTQPLTWHILHENLAHAKSDKELVTLNKMKSTSGSDKAGRCSHLTWREVFKLTKDISREMRNELSCLTNGDKLVSMAESDVTNSHRV